jgi:hypothetical protein
MVSQQFIIHPNHFYSKGMEYIGRSRDSPINQKNMERYRAHFGTSPGVCALLWNEICTIVPRKYCFKHILWGLMFLKVYATESVLAGKIGVDEDTFRDHVWVVVRAIASCKPRLVRSLVLIWSRENSFP